MVEKRPYKKCAKSEKTAEYKPKRGKLASLMIEEAKQDASIHDLSYDFACRITRLFQYLTEDALSIIFQRLMNRFNQADLESDTLDKIKDILRSEMKDHMESDKKPSHISASPASQMLYQHLITELFPSLTEKIKALIHTTKVQESTFLTLDSQLDADDAQEIAKQIHAALQSIAERKSLAQSICRQQKET